MIETIGIIFAITIISVVLYSIRYATYAEVHKNSKLRIMQKHNYYYVQKQLFFGIWVDAYEFCGHYSCSLIFDKKKEAKKFINNHKLNKKE